MRGVVLRSLLCILLACILSQAIAFQCFSRPASPIMRTGPLSGSELRLPSFLPCDWPEPLAGILESRPSSGRTSLAFRCPLPGSDGRMQYTLFCETYGWPARSLVAYRACVLTAPTPAGVADARRAMDEFQRRAGLAAGWRFRDPGTGRTDTIIPVWPLWSGLALNTALYAPVIWAGIHAPGWIRGRRARRQGCCRACAYDLTGIVVCVCPECGARAGTEAAPSSL